jgi:hypothetical protein
MKLFALVALLLAAPFASALQPADVVITTDPAVTVKVTRNKTNTGKTIYITVNPQDNVTVKTFPPPCPAQPASETQTQSCPTGTTGTWTQTRSYTAAPSPTCWVAGAWTPTVAPDGACVTPPPATVATVTAWVRAGLENEPLRFADTQTFRYGDGLNWVTKSLPAGSICNLAIFVTDPAYGVAKFCEVQVTAPAVMQIDGAMPVINKALIPPPAVTYPGPRVRTLSADELKNGVFQPTPTTVGAFREPCRFSHMDFNDPIVFPGQPGLSHLHNFQGADNADAFSTPDSLLTSPSGSCAGGTLNDTSYWMPALTDTRTGQPLVPSSTNFYYKLGYLGVKAGTVQPFPKGLRMIAGNSKSTAPIPNDAIWRIGLECVSGGGHQTSIPSCAIGDELNLAIIFPQCWDGKNLDSPDHQSHMAYPTGTGCPSTHPVPLPEISLNTHYKISEANSGTWLKLSSDNYSGPGGYSMHADWFNGWDDATNKAWLTNCINGNMDCHDQLLGDGRYLY